MEDNNIETSNNSETVITKKDSKKTNGLVKVLVPIIVFFIGCGAMYGVIYAFPAIFSTSITKLEKNVTVTDAGIADAVEKVYDAVVVVSTYKDNKLISSGTGFVYKSEGKTAYILTNNHVIKSGTNVSVTFTNGEVVESKVVGSDTLSDIAVLSVDSSKIISVAEMGKSESMRVGDTTFAVGAPVDSVYSWTVTRGILSGKDRMVEVKIDNETGDYVMKVIQTDTAINSGNSGGPLCNANGEVVGITSLKLISESVEGMGFAIPIEKALDYAEKIEKGESITQPYLGISMVNVTSAFYNINYYEVLSKYNITSGVILSAVEKGGPCSKAGLQVGDIITKVNDKDVKSIGYLRYYVYNYKEGDKITITYLRDGKENTTTVTLGSNQKMF